MDSDIKITADEINKFVFCPYQWYHEKIHGLDKKKDISCLNMAKASFKDKKSLSSGILPEFAYYAKIAGVILFLILVAVMYIVVVKNVS